MTFRRASYYLEECRNAILDGDNREALTLLKDVQNSFTESSTADMHRRFYKHHPRAQAHRDAYAKSSDPDERAFHLRRAVQHDDKAMKRSFPALKKEKQEAAPIAWSGAGRDYKSKIGDFVKRKARGAVGLNGKARKDAADAYKHGQDALAHSQQVAKDTEKYSDQADKYKAKADDLAAKGQTNQADSYRRRADHDTEKAIGAHNQGVKAHQAVMTGFKRTMDQANKEGDRETSDWAAKAGAVHTNTRAWHMKAGSDLRNWASGKGKADAGAGAKTPAAGKAPAPAGDKSHASQMSAAYKDHMAKVAAQRAAKPAAPAPRVSPTVGKPVVGRKPAAQPIRKHQSDTRGATKTGT